MSVLAINIGNTNIHFGLYHRKQIQKYTVKIESEDFLTQLTNTIDMLPIVRTDTEVRISSVNPNYTQQIESVFASRGFENIHLIGYLEKWQVDFHHYQKGQLGLDRMLVCEAAYKRKQLPAIIFDMGTATTMNVIDEAGVFLGGAIFPGVYMGLEALNQKTAQLPHVDLDDVTPNLLGLSTSEAIHSAAIHGNVSMIEGMVARVEKAMNKTAYVYITGGAARILQPVFLREMIYEKHFLLEGLLLLNK